MRNIGLSRRIKLKCFECSAGLPKEVVICHHFGCPLWEARLGGTINSRVYKERMEGAKRRYRKEFQELADMGIKASEFTVSHALDEVVRRKVTD